MVTGKPWRHPRSTVSECRPPTAWRQVAREQRRHPCQRGTVVSAVDVTRVRHVSRCSTPSCTVLEHFQRELVPTDQPMCLVVQFRAPRPATVPHFQGSAGRSSPMRSRLRPQLRSRSRILGCLRTTTPVLAAIAARRRRLPPRGQRDIWRLRRRRYSVVSAFPVSASELIGEPGGRHARISSFKRDRICVNFEHRQVSGWSACGGHPVSRYSNLATRRNNP